MGESSMSILNQFQLFAEYNRLMNRRMMAAAVQLDDAQLTADRGAFFGSLLGTLNHILVGDIIWLKRFATLPAHGEALAYVSNLESPPSLDTMLFDELQDLTAEREKIDTILVNWIARLCEHEIEGYLTYHNMAGEAQVKSVKSLISHLFLHQVHHRGQATTLLSQSAVDFGETDILEILDDYSSR